MDRDLQATRHLVKLARSACGEESVGQRLVALMNLSPLKREPDAFVASAENGMFWRTVYNRAYGRVIRHT